jgi:hypothetical protein
MTNAVASSASNSSSSDFIIWGPSLDNAQAVLNIVHALYYLPEHYKLVLPEATLAQQEAYEQVRALISVDNLDDRVRFTDKSVTAGRQAVVVSDPQDRRPGGIFGSTPEALASEVLRLSRRGR